MKKLLFFIIPLMVFGFCLEGEAQESWLTGWNYRKQITIEGSTAGAQTSYQMKLTVYKGSGTDSGSTVYLNNRCQDNFDDIRFTKSDGTTKLDYWREIYTASNNAVFWIEFDPIPVSPGTANFYIYYDNASASSGSNGAATFFFFEDFNNLNSWTTSGQGSMAVIDSYVYPNSYGAGAGWHGPVLDYNTGFSPIVNFRFKQQRYIQNSAGGNIGMHNISLLDSGGSAVFHLYLHDSWADGAYRSAVCYDSNGVLYTSGTGSVWTSSAWKQDEILRYGNNVKFIIEGTTRYNGTAVATAVADLRLSKTTYSSYGAFEANRTDWMFVGNHVSPEPTFGAWGSREEPPTGPVVLSVSDSPDPINAGNDITFTVYWTSSINQTKIHICKTDAISGQTCTGGSWCDTNSWDSASPTSCSYSTKESDNGINNYYAFVCDSGDICSSSLAGTFEVSVPPPSCADHNVFGFAWSENIGWISFSCKNQNNPGDYGVDIAASTGNFSGYAWSENIGWVSFNSSDLVGCPSGTCQAKVDLGTGQVSGWARALSFGGGWDGWIKMRGSSYGVSINRTTGDFSGYAWSDMVIGWINFQGVNYKVKTSFSFNRPPNKPGTTSESWNHCSIQGLSIPTFRWTYSDPDGDPQAAFEIRIDNDSNFSVQDPEEFIRSGGVSTAFTPVPTEWKNWMNWNADYWWIVRVKDNKGNWSEWSSSDHFRTPSHAYPWPNFSWSPQNPSQGERVIFDPDSSQAYGGTVISSYFWTITQGTGQFIDDTDNTSRYPHITFSAPINKVKLKVTDSTGFFCESVEKEISARRALPEYEEVPPSTWLNKILASFDSFFGGFLGSNYWK